jgi:hypothetical protein
MALEPVEFYKACNLTTNPFRSNPVQEADPRNNIWVGYEREKTLLNKFLVRSRADQVGNANFIMIYGDYGTGKSHALLWAKHQILETHKAEFESVAYYIQTLKWDGKISLASAFKNEIIAKSNIINDVLNLEQFLSERITEYKKLHKLGPEAGKEAVLEKIVVSSDLFNLAKEVLRCENEEHVKALLVPKGLGDHQAMTIFTTLINLFVFEYRIGDQITRFKNGAYLFIDELDLLSTSPAKEARETNELLRHIYDNCPNCFCLILGFTATSAEIGNLFAPYVLSRVSRQIRMDIMPVDEATNFVCQIMDTSRTDDDGPKKCFPFEGSAIDAIVSQIVSITPRKIINAMQQILEEVRLCSFDPSDGLISREYLDDNDIIDEVVGIS